MLTCLGMRVTGEEMQEMLAEADIDRDGLVRYHEFLKLCKSQPLIVHNRYR